MDWIKFKRSLTQGTKRVIPRAARFIYLELSLAAGDLAGDIILPATGTVVDAVHEVIAGNRREIAAALPLLTAPDADGESMVEVLTEPGQRVLRVVAWERHNKVDDSSDRVRRYREKRRLKRDGERDVTESVTRDSNDGNGDVTPSRAHAYAHAHLPSSSLLGSQGDPRGGGSSTPVPAVPLAGAALAIREELEAARDLLVDIDLDAVARRTGRLVDNDPRCKPIPPTQIGAELAAHVRRHAAKYERATPVQLAAEVDTKLTYIFRDLQLGKFRPVAPTSGTIRSAPIDDDAYQAEALALARRAKG